MIKAEFQKVKYEQFRKDCINSHYYFTTDSVDIIMPKRATAMSAGYDIYPPFDVPIRSDEEVTIPTGLKVKLPDGYFLMLVPRSSLGMNYGIALANTVGIIDADYYNNPSNEGHILVRLVNRGNKTCIIPQYKAICQGLIFRYETTEDDKAEAKRLGGIGSTDI